jgi:drug/metabolite transporter (DMT)-like permease
MPTGLLFGLASALSWGTGDFAGGLASRRASIIAALLGSQGFGLLFATLIFLVAREPAPVLGALGWAALAGLSGAVGLGSFYRAMRAGPMGIAAPVVAVVGAGIPALVGVVRGDVLDTPQLVGIGLALVAVAVVSIHAETPSRDGEPPPTDGAKQNPERSRGRARATAVAPMLVAGLGFAGFFLLIDQAAQAGAGIWWSVLAARVAALVAIVAVVLLFRLAARPARSDAPVLAVAGIGDVGGNAFFVLANAEGPLSVAAVVSSLYPVVTVLLARVLLGERLTKIQLVGVGLALAGIVLISR